MSRTKNHTGALYFWLAYGAIALVLLLRGPSLAFPFTALENDDAMRLVQLRDWLGGQGWFDLTQYRLGLDEPIVLHWSRLIDLPLAALIWFFSLFTTPEYAEHLTLIIWPFLVLIPFLYAVKRGAEALGGMRAGLVALYLAFGIVLSNAKFFAGSLDHHNVQMTLIALALWGVFDVARIRYAGLMTGAALALSLAIGLEAIPFVAIICVFVALAWAFEAEKYQTYCLEFALSFVGVIIVNFALTRPDRITAEFQCDMLDLGLSQLALFGAAGLAILVMAASDQARLRRFVFLGVLGMAVLAYAANFSPACLVNPLDQLHESVERDWLGRVAESLPIQDFIRRGNPGAFGALVLPVLAIGASVLLISYAQSRFMGAVLAVGIAVGYALIQYQTRNMIFLLMFCIYPLAWYVAVLIGRYRARKTGPRGMAILAGLILSSFPLWGIAYAVFGASGNAMANAPVAAQAHNCSDPAHYAQLRDLKAGRVIAGTNLADEILKETPHSVLTSNFHRNHDGIKAVLDWAQAGPETAFSRAKTMDAQWVVYCKGDVISLQGAKGGAFTTWAAFIAGDVPTGFERVSDEDAVIQIFKVN